MTELERFESNTWRGHVPSLWLTVHTDLGTHPDETLQRILSGIEAWVRMVSTVDSLDIDAYPTSEELVHLLPEWLIDHFTAPTSDEVLVMPPDIGTSPGRRRRWDYETWVDLMVNRCWQWLAFRREGNMLTMEVEVDGLPCPLTSLEYLVRAAGASAFSIQEDDSSGYV